MNNPRLIVKVLLTTTIFSILFVGNIFAQSLDSGNYSILDFTVGHSGGISQAGNYGLLLSGGEILADTRFNGTNYQMSFGTPSTWRAQVPEIVCFEVDSNGVTNCDDPDVANGMVQLCGGGGCYNKARFEINPRGNAPDALYSIQITTDPSWSSYNFIDGNTMLIEDASTHDIDDYLTETAWENTPNSINIYGLESGVTYYLRATALHGNFTETIPGPPASTSITVPLPQISIDYDIATSSGMTTETPEPYVVQINGLLTGTIATSEEQIWLDIDSNLVGGTKMYVRGINNGLYSASESYLIPTVSGDLNSTTGFGIQANYSGQTYLGSLIPNPDYNNGGEVVGAIPAVPYSKEILSTSSQPIYKGRASFIVKARPPESTPDAVDYTEILIFTATGEV